MERKSRKKKKTASYFRGLGIDFYQELCQRIERDTRNYPGFLNLWINASSKYYGV